MFFLPTVTETYEEVDVKAALCDGMELMANSVQGFGSWGRRVGYRELLLGSITWTDSMFVAYHGPQGDDRELSTTHVRFC